MVAISIVTPYLASGEPFPIQVSRTTTGNATLTLKVGIQSRPFAIDDGPAQASVTVSIVAGYPNDFTVKHWGSASVGSKVTMTVTAPEGAKSDEATVGS